MPLLRGACQYGCEQRAKRKHATTGKERTYRPAQTETPRVSPHSSSRICDYAHPRDSTHSAARNQGIAKAAVGGARLPNVRDFVTPVIRKLSGT